MESWPRTRRGSALLIVASAAVAMAAAMFALDAPLRAAGDGTIAFELAGNPERSAEIVDGWRAEELLARAGLINGLDFLYAPLYAVAIAGACVGAAGIWRRHGNERVATLGIAIAWAAIAAAAFDWIENAALAVILLDGPTSPWPQIALAAAIPKFTCIALGLVYALSGPLRALGPSRA